jgi:ankyrin repeat protein
MLLIESGCDVNLQRNGRFALLVAVRNTWVYELYMILGTNKCDVNVVSDDAGNSALHEAVLAFPKLLYLSSTDFQFDVFKMVLNAGCNVKIANHVGDTALHMAIRGNNVLCAEKLLNFGSDPNAYNSDGDTPLHIATTNKNVNAVTQLLAGGSDVFATNKDGHTPLQLCKLFINTCNRFKDTQPYLRWLPHFTHCETVLIQAEEEHFKKLVLTAALPHRNSTESFQTKFFDHCDVMQMVFEHVYPTSTLLKNDSEI